MDRSFQRNDTSFVLFVEFQENSQRVWSDGRPIGLQLWGPPHSPPSLSGHTETTGEELTFLHRTMTGPYFFIIP